MADEQTYRGFSSININDYDTQLFDKELAIQDLINEFMTVQGERVMRPSFGSIIHTLLFDFSHADTEKMIYDDAKRIVDKDPRFTFQDASITSDDNGQSFVLSLDMVFVPDVDMITLNIQYVA